MILRRIAAALALAVLLSSALVAAAVAYPQPLFGYGTEQGRLALYSDRPFDLDKAKVLLAEVDRRLKLSPLDTHNGVRRIFVTNSAWRARLFFLWNYGVGGVNYYPFTRNVFIRRSDIDRDRVFGRAGPVQPPRTFTYFAAHEIAHSLTGEAIGPLAYHRLPVWIREGLADYIGLAAPPDFDSLLARWRAGDPALDPQRSGLYLRYRLLTTYYLERLGWSVDRLLHAPVAQAEAEAHVLSLPRR
jgi:hypothetical protein